MTEPAKRPATCADLEKLPPHLVGGIVLGRVITISLGLHRPFDPPSTETPSDERS